MTTAFQFWVSLLGECADEVLELVPPKHPEDARFLGVALAECAHNKWRSALDLYCQLSHEPSQHDLSMIYHALAQLAMTASPSDMDTVRANLTIANARWRRKPLIEPLLCSVCLEGQRCLVFEPCHHMVTCESCGGKLDKCPICRCAISNRTRIYIA